MTAIITHEYRFQNLLEAKRRTSAGEDQYYLAIGRSESWDNDALPPVPQVDKAEGFAARRTFQGFKKIADIVEAAPRHDWVSGNIYTAYDDADENLHSRKYYVLNTNTFNVYICLRAGPGASTVEPFGIDDDNTNGGTTGVAGSSTPQVLADGYMWKYLYTMSAVQITKFLTRDFMPVIRNQDVADNAVFGAIYDAVVTDGGAGYTSAPTVTVEGDGTGATATATISNGEVDNVEITSFGTGYSVARIVLSGGGASTPATVRPVVSHRIAGRAIESIDVISGGTNYTNGSLNLTVNGDGVGAQVTATVTGGVIQGSPTVDDGGYGYTRASAIPDETTSGTAADLEVVFSAPKGGSGYDPVRELNAFYLLFNVVLDGAEGSGDFIPGNDYRQLAIVKNPLINNANVKAFAETTGLGLDYLTVQSGGTWIQDDVITGGSSGAKAIMNYYDPNTDRVYYTQNETVGFGSFSDGETLTGDGLSTGSVDAAVGSADGIAEVDRFSGEILYLENRAPVSRSSDQTEDIKIVIQF